MQLPSEFSAFWHVRVYPGIPCTLSIPEESRCTLTNVALAEISDSPHIKGSRAVLTVSVNGSEACAVAPLTSGLFESTIVDVKFDGGDQANFSIFGDEMPVDLSGYFLGAEVSLDNGVPTPPQSPAIEVASNEETNNENSNEGETVTTVVEEEVVIQQQNEDNNES